MSALLRMTSTEALLLCCTCAHFGVLQGSARARHHVIENVSFFAKIQDAGI
jgi:hypothetical protein